jgi:hypothetical protein
MKGIREMVSEQFISEVGEQLFGGKVNFGGKSAFRLF